MENEYALVEKILRTGHISVPEAHSLPNGVVRKSVACTVIKDALDRDGWFPDQETVKRAGLSIEKATDGGYIFHETHVEEKSGRYSDLRIYYKEGEESELAAKYLEEKGEFSRDGLHVDIDGTLVDMVN